MRVLIYILFLIAYGLWVAASTFATQKMQKDVPKGKSFWGSELLILLGYGGFFGFTYLLSGFWNTRLVLLFLLSAQAGIVVAYVFNVATGGRDDQTGKRGMWAGGEMGIKNETAMKISQILMAAVFLAFPIVAGVFYFRHPRGSDELKMMMIKYQLVQQILAYIPVLLLFSAVLASENLDEDTRQRYFINQLSGMIPMTPYLALAVWVFGIGGTLQKFDPSAAARTFSVRTLLLVLGVFVALILIPSVLGTMKAGRKRIALLSKEREYAAKMQDILISPTKDLYAARLQKIKESVAKERADLVENDQLLRLAAELEGLQVPEQMRPFADALSETKDMDPRFKLLEHFRQVEKDSDEVVSNLAARSADTVETAAAVWGKKFENRKNELSEEIKSTKDVKPLVFAVLGTLTSLVLSSFFGEVGKKSWELISSAK